MYSYSIHVISTTSFVIRDQIFERNDSMMSSSFKSARNSYISDLLSIYKNPSVSCVI